MNEDPRPDRLEAAADRIAVAAVLDAHGRLCEAELTLHEVLSVFESVLGRDHYEVALALDRLAAILQRSGKEAQAVALHQRSVDIRRRVLGSDHIEVAETLCNLGSALIAAGRLDEGDAALRAALPALERAAHPGLARCRADLERVRRRR
jgi:tetratricopeptide (TPR) repeat protein